MKTYVFLVIGLLFASSAFAQQSVVETAKAELEAAHVDVSGPCGAVKITNLVASRVHYRLLVKRGGNRATLRPDGSCLSGEQSGEPGFATDYVIDPSTFFGFDLLGDGGGANRPQWSGPETDFVARNKENAADPIDPSTYLHSPVNPPVTPPVEPNVLAEIEKAIQDLDRDIEALRAAVLAQDAKLDALKAQADVNTEKVQQQIDQAIKNAEKSLKDVVNAAGGASALIKILTLGVKK